MTEYANIIYSSGKVKRVTFDSLPDAIKALIPQAINADEIKAVFNTMPDPEVARTPREKQLRKNAKVLADELAKILKDLEEESSKPSLPEEPSNMGVTTYVTFVKYFSGVKGFEYAAIRPHNKNKWTITGRPAMGTDLSWDDLVKFVQRQERDRERALSSITYLYRGSRVK